ncbi:hypothetical protein ES703_98471 [subsurface metagenome]
MLPEALRRINTAEQEKKDLSSKLVGTNAKNEEQQKSIESLGSRLLKDNVKFIGSKITANNYATSKKKYETAFTFCEKHGYSVPAEIQKEILGDLKNSFEEVVRKQWEKEEQARIKRQIREEQKLEADRQRELQRLENQELVIQTALQKALQKAHDEHDAEVQRLKAQLEEAQDKLQRAKSMAELTKAGFVYVISNIGSFGENVFKVGMTRRLEPNDRVRELGDASVPFRYDVHMMISSDDAPALENALHKELHKFMVNKVNPRREFFKADIDTIAKLVQKYHGKVDYVATPEALEYNESLNMSEEDFDFVSEQLSRFEEDEEGYHPTAQPQSSPKEPITPAGAKEETTSTSVTPISVETETVSEPTHEQQQPTEHPKEKRRTAACPHCKGSIYIDTLVNGRNVCPHCEHTFKVKGK